jgi:hypothetical protein
LKYLTFQVARIKISSSKDEYLILFEGAPKTISDQSPRRIRLKSLTYIDIGGTGKNTECFGIGLAIYVAEQDRKLKQERNKMAIQKKSLIGNLTAAKKAIIATNVASTSPVVTSASLAKATFAKGTLAKGALAKGTLAKGTLAKGTLAKGTLAKGTLAKGTLAKGTLAKGTLAKGTLAKGTFAKRFV